MTKCYVCGSRFADLDCNFCNNNVCSSCYSTSKEKCTRCIKIKKTGFIRRNLHYILMFVALWFFVSGLYPFPYYYAVGIPVDFGIVQPVFIATAIMIIPFILMMIAWKKKSK